ncbi:MAG: hypothetical protein KDA55_14345, partial [Planctomycetales bacterium]|nr:hypothetical protein [Planctomycetales bacterium]
MPGNRSRANLKSTDSRDRWLYSPRRFVPTGGCNMALEISIRETTSVPLEVEGILPETVRDKSL